MKLLRVLTPMVVAVFAASVYAASAQAEGPFYRVATKRLSSGEKAEITGTGGTYTLTAGTFKVTCTAQTLEPGSEIDGSNAGNGGTGFETGKFTGCSVVGNGTGSPETAGECKVVGGTITTNLLETSLAQPKEKLTKGETLLTIFVPGSGSVLASIKFEGKCIVSFVEVEGGVAAEDLDSKGTPVKAEENEPEAEIGMVRFPTTAITETFFEFGGKHTKLTVGLTAFAKRATLVGKSSVKLVSKKAWGVVTK